MKFVKDHCARCIAESAGNGDQTARRPAYGYVDADVDGATVRVPLCEQHYEASGGVTEAALPHGASRPDGVAYLCERSVTE